MIRDLGDGLILRRATAADIEALAAFTADVLRYQDADAPDERTAAWTRDLMDGRHPQVRAEDFLICEDTRRQCLASCTALLAQTWSYGGIPLRVGQIELVGTHPDYRGRGLVREQFAVLHQRPVDLFAIDGIPWFYRQFGYEMALQLRGEISIDAARVRGADNGRYRVRAAQQTDLPYIAATYERGCGRYLVSSRRSAERWLYELSGRSPSSSQRVVLAVVETQERTPVGCLAHFPRLSGNSLVVTALEVEPELALDAVGPSVLRYLRDTGASDAADGELRRIGFHLGTEHPIYALLDDCAARDEGAYAWYLRIPDLGDFLRRIAPLLEHRLAESELAAFSGTVHVSFYRDGLELSFERGTLREVTGWRQPLDLVGIEKMEPSAAMRATAYFPSMTFLQLLFGYRSLDELQRAFPDCLTRSDEARALLEILLPKLASNVWPVL